MLCPPPPAVRSGPCAASAVAPTAGSSPEPVEVRTEPVDGVETPTQLLRHGRLWLVRSAQRAPGAAEHWRVEAASGPATTPAVLDLRQAPSGHWSLTEPPVAAAEVAGWA